MAGEDDRERQLVRGMYPRRGASPTPHPPLLIMQIINS